MSYALLGLAQMACPDPSPGHSTMVAITAIWVLSLMNKLQPSAPWVMDYPQVADSIAQASNEDPLFPSDRAGSAKTAVILVALAWHESRFHASAVGDNGASFGLFQIQPRTANVEATLLTNPRNASFIAVGLIRDSFRACYKRPWDERLVHYISTAGCTTREGIVRQSKHRLQLAARLLLEMPPVLQDGDQAAGVPAPVLAERNGEE